MLSGLPMLSSTPRIDPIVARRSSGVLNSSRACAGCGFAPRPPAMKTRRGWTGAHKFASDYCFTVAKHLGARAITCEPPLSQTKRLGRFADRHQMVVAYHNHSNISSVEAFGRTGAWEQAFFYSKNNWANADVGHFTAGNGKPPIDFLREYHSRITNIHLKDRKINGPNMPWGQGDTPLKEILQMMKRENYKFTATIELEYPIPDGSSVVKEVANCVTFCKDALR